jgi:hypothetical protein
VPDLAAGDLDQQPIEHRSLLDNELAVIRTATSENGSHQGVIGDPRLDT